MGGSTQVSIRPHLWSDQEEVTILPPSGERPHPALTCCPLCNQPEGVNLKSGVQLRPLSLNTSPEVVPVPLGTTFNSYVYLSLLQAL